MADDSSDLDWFERALMNLVLPPHAEEPEILQRLRRRLHRLGPRHLHTDDAEPDQPSSKPGSSPPSESVS